MKYFECLQGLFKKDLGRFKMNGTSVLSNKHHRSKILLVEDNQEIADLISLNLSILDIDIDHCISAQHARKKLLSGQYSAILLERELPDGDGISLCLELRKKALSISAMIITSKATEADIVLGLESGADDYLTKPFNNLELTARVKALLRRNTKSITQITADACFIEHGLIRIDTCTREVFAKNISIELTATEFDLLHHLAIHPQQVFSRIQLLEAVWGYNYEGYEHTVNSHINRLRAKLSPHLDSGEIVKTVWGVGYRFIPPENKVA